MKTKQTLKTTTAWLIFFACALAPVHCTKEDPAGSGEPSQNAKTDDENAVSEAKENLVIGYSGEENADGVTGNITLPLAGIGSNGEGNGVTITWASDNDDVINVVETRGTGVVTQPAPGENDVKVTLTATLTKGGATDTATFPLVVLARTSTPRDPGDCPAAPSGYTSPNKISETDTRLVCSYEKSSGNASLDDECPAQEGLTFRGSSASGSLLTCNWTKNSTSDTDAVTAAKNALAIGYTGGDGPTSVTGNVTLPTSGADGVMIAWESSHTSIISAGGVVTRPDDMNTDVVLTATLSRGAAADQTKTFTLTVIISASGADTAAVTAAKNALAVTYTLPDTAASSVTGNVTLPTSGADGVSIRWMSSHPSIISMSGVVTRPDDMNTDVTLTATLSKGVAADQTKTFTLTVIISASGADTNAVTAAKNALGVTYTSGDTASSVTGNLTLPTSGADGVSDFAGRLPTTSDHKRMSGVVIRPDDMNTDVTAHRHP